SGSITFGNFNLTLGSCTYQLNNGASTNCNNDDIEISVTNSNGALTLNFVNSLNPGTPLMSQATGNGCTYIQFELTISNASGLSKAFVSDAGQGKAGSTLDNWFEAYNTSNRLAEARI